MLFSGYFPSKVKVKVDVRESGVVHCTSTRYVTCVKPGMASWSPGMWYAEMHFVALLLACFAGVREFLALLTLYPSFPANCFFCRC